MERGTRVVSCSLPPLPTNARKAPPRRGRFDQVRRVWLKQQRKELHKTVGDDSSIGALQCPYSDEEIRKRKADALETFHTQSQLLFDELHEIMGLGYFSEGMPWWMPREAVLLLFNRYERRFQRLVEDGSDLLSSCAVDRERAYINEMRTDQARRFKPHCDLMPSNPEQHRYLKSPRQLLNEWLQQRRA